LTGTAISESKKWDYTQGGDSVLDFSAGWNCVRENAVPDWNLLDDYLLSVDGGVSVGGLPFGGTLPDRLVPDEMPFRLSPGGIAGAGGYPIALRYLSQSIGLGGNV
jgi:hypothetical protein